MRAKQAPPGLRVDGGKRINLKQQRERRAAGREARMAVSTESIEDTRVAEVWAREEVRQAVAEYGSAEARRLDKVSGGAQDGAKISSVKVRISNHRSETQAIRSRPGTFEWRYGRNRQDALFHAGSHLAILWERAGIAVASSADFLTGVSSGCVTGISDGRVAALDRLRGFAEYMGRAPSARMVDYCVMGLTTAQIAVKTGAKERDMPAVLHQDLRECAFHFDFLGKQG